MPFMTLHDVQLYMYLKSTPEVTLRNQNKCTVNGTGLFSYTLAVSFKFWAGTVRLSAYA